MQKILNYANLNGDATSRQMLVYPVTVHAKFQAISINRIGEVFFY